MSDEKHQSKKRKLDTSVNGGYPAPHNHYVDPMLTDLYQISMAYAYWVNGRQDEEAVFDLFFRKSPFKGEFTVFAGLDECLRFIANFKFTAEQVDWLRQKFPTWKSGFFDYLATVSAEKIKVYAIPEGTVVFPRVPLIRIEGPLAVAQLMETTLLVLVNYASLVTTNAARHRIAAGPDVSLLEFGLRRAQGPDGAMSASRYAYMGGFDGTSNVKAGQVYGIDIKGTHAHSFVVSYTSLSDIKDRTIEDADGKTVDFVDIVLRIRHQQNLDHTNNGELTAFIAYAQAYPTGFLALVDTYDTLTSGVPNYIIVAAALHKCGRKAVGIRLDSGDLAYLSIESRKLFQTYGDKLGIDYLGKSVIVASNDINEKVLWSLREQGHQINSFGIGTHLVTCQAQPALGCVYKLVEIQGKNRIKLSQDIEKVTIPGRKESFRLFNNQGQPCVDLLITAGSVCPVPQRQILCRHPFDATKRFYMTPTTVEPLHYCYWDGRICMKMPTLDEIRSRVFDQLKMFRADHMRRINPTPYKISLTSDLHTMMHDLWQSESIIPHVV